MTLEQQVLQAVARGWCHPKNYSKEMDSDLAEAITAEVVKSLTPQVHQEPATVAELEAILNSEDDREITINSDGSISAR